MEWKFRVWKFEVVISIGIEGATGYIKATIGLAPAKE